MILEKKCWQAIDDLNRWFAFLYSSYNNKMRAQTIKYEPHYIYCRNTEIRFGREVIFLYIIIGMICGWKSVLRILIDTVGQCFWAARQNKHSGMSTL